MVKNFNLSYPVQTVSFDGVEVTALSDDDIIRKMGYLQDAGISLAMLFGYHLEEKSAFDMDLESKRIGELFRKNGFRITQHHSVVPSFSAGDTPQSKTIDRIKRCIDFTANLGAENIVFHAGRVFGHYSTGEEYNQEFLKEAGRIGIRNLLELCAENIRAAGDYAAGCNVKIALENVERSEPFCDPVYLPELIALVDHPAVGFCLDSGHAHCAGNDPVQWIKTMNRKVFTTHLHDNRGADERIKPGDTSLLSTSGIDEHLTPGLGTIDWRKVIKALREYTALQDLTFETNGWPLADPAEGFKMAIKFWRLLEEKSL
ncbi:MAG: sugar phosphate isomerase/epimerase [Lentisphaeria bacterium]|nr:sugar phosphate isomerase/epimerase [Lentisphaeria bacterium]